MSKLSVEHFLSLLSSPNPVTIHIYSHWQYNLKQAGCFSMNSSTHFMKSVLVRPVGTNYTAALSTSKYLKLGFSKPSVKMYCGCYSQ